MNIDTLGLSEIRWTGSGNIQKEQHTILYSGGDNHTRGVGITINKTINKAVGTGPCNMVWACIRLNNHDEDSRKTFNIGKHGCPNRRILQSTRIYRTSRPKVE